MYRLSIWLIALAFVFNGAASFAAIDRPVAPALAAQNHNGGRITSHDVHFNHIGTGVMVTMLNHDQAHGHSGLRCCGTCNVANVLPDIAAIPVTFSCAAVTFRTGQHDLVGYLVALDPDLPKTVV
jgi:hypothetical protein